MVVEIEIEIDLHLYNILCLNSNFKIYYDQIDTLEFGFIFRNSTRQQCNSCIIIVVVVFMIHSL